MNCNMKHKILFHHFRREICFITDWGHPENTFVQSFFSSVCNLSYACTHLYTYTNVHEFACAHTHTEYDFMLYPFQQKQIIGRKCSNSNIEMTKDNLFLLLYFTMQYHCCSQDIIYIFLNIPPFSINSFCLLFLNVVFAPQSSHSQVLPIITVKLVVTLKYFACFIPVRVYT